MSPEEFITVLERIPGELRELDFREPLVETAREVGPIVAGNFLRNEDANGVAWAPHSPVTIALHGEHELLRLTYDMHTASTDFEGDGSKRRVEPREVEFGIDGTEIPYARYQQSGTRKIPARPFFYVRDSDMHRLVEVFRQGAIRIVQREVLS